MVFETLQITYFVLHPRYTFLWVSPILNIIQSVLKYIQVSFLLEQESSILFQALLFSALGLVITTFGLNLYVSSKTKIKDHINTLKLLGVYAFFLTTALYMPLINIFLSGLYCVQRTHGLECSDGSVYIYMVLSGLGVIFLIPQVYLYNKLYVDLNPFSEFPNASLPSIIPTIKFILKTLLPLYVLVDTELEYGKIIIIILLILATIIVIVRIRVPAYYKRDTLNCVVLCEGMLMWVTICTTIQAFIEKTGEEKDIMSITYFIIGIPLFNFAIVASLLTQRENQVLQTDPNKFYKPDEIRVYVNIFIKSIEEQMIDRKVQVKIMGILKEHQDKCISKLCACKNMSPAQMKKDGQNENRRQWYLIMRNILLMYLEKNSKCPDIILLSSYIHFERLNLKYKALTDLMKLEELNPSIQVQYCMYFQKLYIEEDIKINDDRNESNNTMDVNSIVLFQNQFVKFTTATEVSVKMHSEFWIELMEPKIDIYKLNILGEKIQNSVSITAQEYKKLVQINNNNLMSMEIYANYMRQVVNNEEFADKLLIKLAYAQKNNQNILENQKSQGGTTSTVDSSKSSAKNNNTCVITISANLREFGIIQNSNYDLMRMLAFKRIEVVGNNINMLMPKVFSANHDNILNNYIENSNNIVLGQSKLVIPMNKDGFAVPSNLVVKVLPNLEDGMQLVGFLTELKPYFCPPYINEDYSERYTQHYLVFDKHKFTITTCTYSCFQFFGIPKSLIDSSSSAANGFTLDLIIPDICDTQILNKLQQKQVELELDTTIIGTQFMITESTKKDDQNLSQDNMIQNNNFDDGEISIFNSKGLDTTNNVFINSSGEQQLIDGKDGFRDIIVEEPKSNLNASNFLGTPPQNTIGHQNVNLSMQENEELEKMNLFNFNINKAYEDYMEIKYKKTQIKAQIVQETQGQFILLFEDLQEPERKNKADIENSYQNQENNNDQLINKMNISRQMEEKENEYIMDDDEQKLVQQQNLEIENHQQISSRNTKSKTKNKTKSSIGQSTLDEISQEQRYIKDLQFAFSDKTSSYIVKVIKKVSFFLYIVFVSILTYQFIQKVSLRKNLQNSIQAIYVANNRHTVMPDTNFFVRQLYLQANNYFEYDTEQEKEEQKLKIQKILKEKVQMLHEIQFEVLEQIQIIKDFYDGPIEQAQYKLNFQMPNGNIFNDNYTLTDGMIQMIAAATSISTSKLENLEMELIMTEYTDDQRYLYYILENTMTDLRDGSEMFSIELQKIYINYVNNFETPNLLLMIFNLIITITFGVVLVPLIFISYDQNNELLSVFALIPYQEIQYFASECNLFNTNYLVERSIDQIIKDKKKQNQSEKDQIQKKEDKINKQLNKIKKENDTQNQNQFLTTEIKHTEGQMITQNDQNQKDKQQSVQTQENQLQNLKVQTGVIEEDLDEDEKGRSDRIINSQKNYKQKVIIKFTILSVLFIIYFISDNILETIFLSDVKLCIDHTQKMAARPSHIKYALVFALEEIITGKEVWYDGSEMLQAYSKKIYDNEQDVEQSYKEGYPNNFDSYIEMFKVFNYGNVCEDSMWTKLKQEQGYDFVGQCSILQGGVLEKGIVQSIKTIYENIRTFITDWRQKTNRGITMSLQLEYLNSLVFIELVELQDFLLPILYKLLDNFKDMYQDFIASSQTLQEITFSCIIIIITSCFLFAWIPYILAIGANTQRIKGMLNMLPISLILKNAELKAIFNKDGILRYFK